MTDERRSALTWIARENSAGRKPMLVGSAALLHALKREALITWDRGWSLTAKGKSEMSAARVA